MKKDFFTKNLTLKIFSLLIAIVIWFVVMNIQNPVTTQRFNEIPVDIKNLEAANDKGFYVATLNDDGITVYLKGTILDLQAISKGSLRAEVVLDLDSLQKGKIKVPVKIKGLRGSIQLERDAFLSLNIESKRVIQKNIDVVIEGAPKKDYISMPVKIEPNTVQLQGPESKMKQVDRVIVNVNIDEKSNTVTTKVPIKVLDKEGNQISGIENSVTSVRVEVPIFKTKIIPITYKLEGSLADGYVLNEQKTILSHDSIKIAADPEVLKDLKEYYAGTVDISNLNSDKDVSLLVRFPSNVMVIDNISFVNLHIELERLLTETISVPYEVENLSKNLNIVSKPDTATLTVQGLEEDIEEAVSGLQAKVDLNGTAEGIHQVQPMISNVSAFPKLKILNIHKVQLQLQTTP